MKNKILWLIILLFVYGYGCKTNELDKSFNYPPDINQLCIKAREDSKTGIMNCGTPLAVRYGCTVIKVNGEKYINGMWTWNYLGYGLIGGMCTGSKIYVGCNPNTGGEVSYGVLFHENGHYWLISNKGDGTHNAKYDSVFNWSNLRKDYNAEGFAIDSDFNFVNTNLFLF